MKKKNFFKTKIYFILVNLVLNITCYFIFNITSHKAKNTIQIDKRCVLIYLDVYQNNNKHNLYQLKIE